MARAVKWILGGLASFLLLLLLAAGGLWLWLQGSLPQVEGRIAIGSPGAAVEIVRDRNGVPHIFARSMHDAFYAQGFVHAQDRLWQMEMNRRIGAGRLAEILGPPALGIDKFIRTLGLYRYAAASFETLDARTRALLEAYAAGVNAFLRSRDGPLPPEFLILRHEPEPWTPADSLVWLKLMSLDLGENWKGELLRLRLARRLTAEQIDDLFAPYAAGAAEGVADFAAIYELFPAEALARLAERAPGSLGEGAGSNNWVVDGGRSASGKPLLANDTHLGLTAPSIWHLAHLSWPGANLVGATSPGFPGVILGRNDRIAWGLTNTNPDVQDLYIERLEAGDPSRYQTPDGPRAFETRREVIRVDGADDVELVVRESRHGPVISDVYPEAAAAMPEGHVLALQWTALTAEDRSAQAIIDMQLARTWREFVEAMPELVSPQQNIVYADVDGNIGFYAPGLVPIRRPENRIMGFMPQPGWDAAYDWAGFIPFEALPHAAGPASGMIATANHKIVDDSYPYHITYDWADPYRVERIRELLRGRERHSIDSFREIQQDVVSPMARELLPRLLAVPPRDAEAEAAHRLLAAWDGSMAADRAEPLLFNAWYRELTREIYADELGPLFGAAWSKRPRFIAKALGGEAAAWCDDVRTQDVEDCDEQIADALGTALVSLRLQHGEDMTAWRWGEAHVARSHHRPFSEVPLLRRLFDIAVPSSGATYTINVGHHRIGDLEAPFANVHAPAFRAIYDLSDLDRSLFMHTTGQAGNPLSPHYSDLAEPWARGGYIAISTRRADIEAQTAGALLLEPVPSTQ